MSDFTANLATELKLQPQQITNTIKLLDEENTVPFITRYRKEVTGGLDETQIRDIKDKYEYHQMLEDRKATVLESIESQDKLTDELAKKIREATKLKTVEDLYLPYKPKKRTLATKAREKGLGDLGEEIWKQDIDSATLETKIKEAVDPENELPSEEEVELGLQHILAEFISETIEVRDDLRKLFQDKGLVQTTATSDEEAKKDSSVYQDYFEFSQSLADIPPHRVLAINRGEKEKALRVNLEVPEEEAVQKIEARVINTEESKVAQLMSRAAADSYQRLLYPSLGREARSELTLRAEEHAIGVFAQNLRKLLLSPPVWGKTILGVDPGFRTGCKLAVIDDTGKLLEVGAMFPHPPQKQTEKSESTVLEMIKKYNVDLVAIGNGTAHRESEEFIAELIGKHQLDIEYTVVNEAGASVYSTSKEARDEFPEMDASLRGTVSIARRLQDPLAEIVKIDPKSIGVGMYQHDVNQKALGKAVDEVVESCVNYVGVDLNTASVSLLKYVSGLNRLTAKRIYEWRRENQKFNNRDELLKVRGIGRDTFVQAAGFLKIPNGSNPLDNTQIHPESYDKSQGLLTKIEVPLDKVPESSFRSTLHQRLEGLKISDLAKELEVGEPTLKDIVENLKKPGRDPRDKMQKPQFKKGILRLADLQEGMELSGTVRNVVDFGAFVDIGVKEDGLVHVSELADRFVKDPMEVVSVGDVVKVKVLGVDLNRGRISLSMRKNPGKKGGGGGRKSRGKGSGGKKSGKGSSSSSHSSSSQKSSSGGGRLGALLKKKGLDKK